MDKRITANEYLIKLKEVDYSVFDDFFRCFYGYMREVAYCNINDKSCVDDVVQLTFETIINHVAEFDESKSGYAWMVTIAKHHAITHIRKNKKYDKSQVVEELIKNDEEELDDTDSLIFQYALDRLDPKGRKIIELKVLEGLTLKAISEKMDMKYNAVFFLYHKNLKILAEILK